VSFPEKKFKEKCSEARNDMIKDEIREWWARWGYSECDEELTPVLEGLMKATKTNFEQGRKEGFEEGFAAANRNADDAEANGKIIGYDLAVTELKARDANILFEANEILREHERGWFIKIPTRAKRIKALLLLSEEEEGVLK